METWLWPCPGNSRITSGVGPRWGTSHNGIDIAAPRGSNIVASRSGKVIRTYSTCSHNYGKTKAQLSSDTCGGGYGNHVYIDHGDGFITRYAHMTDVKVAVGNTVSKGQIIGTVGSTGKSTGFHLHFEIRKNNTVVDPEQYVVYSASSGTISQTPTTYPVTNSNTGHSTGAITKILNSTGHSTGSPKMVSHIPNSPLYMTTSNLYTNGKPLHAFVDIYIGNKETGKSYKLSYTHGKPSAIKNFEINKIGGAGSSARFTIFDDNWDEIEMYLADNWDNIHMRYGYVDNDYFVSPYYKMLLQNYSIDFVGTGVILSIQAISESSYKNLDSIASLDTETKNPTEAVKRICEYMEWKVKEENFTATLTVEDRLENYILRDASPAQYIKEVIIPEARTESDEIVSFYVDADEDNTAYLTTETYKEDEEYSETEYMRNYVYMKGYDSVVQDVNFDIKGVFGGTSAFSIVTGYKSTAYDVSSKEATIIIEDQKSIRGHSKAKSAGTKTHTNVSQSTLNLATARDSNTQTSNKFYYELKSSINSQYEATMTIIGDPTIKLLETIRLINITDRGSLHHTSGIYLIKGITDSISNGTYLTTLKLQRDSDISEGSWIIDELVRADETTTQEVNS